MCKQAGLARRMSRLDLGRLRSLIQALSGITQPSEWGSSGLLRIRAGASWLWSVPLINQILILSPCSHALYLAQKTFRP